MIGATTAHAAHKRYNAIEPCISVMKAEAPFGNITLLYCVMAIFQFGNPYFRRFEGN